MMRRFALPARSRGFTLVEVVLTIVIIGIVAGMVAVFIRAPILSYRDAVDRAELTDQADLALRRIARDIRLALPNSVRVSADGSQLELLQTRSGARYLSTDDGVPGNVVLSFEDKADLDFIAAGPPSSFSSVRAGDFVVVYNLGPGFEPANAYALADTGVNINTPCAGAASAAGNIACITGIASYSGTINGVTVSGYRITLAANPFAWQDTPLQSPLQRFQVVSGPVSFYCVTNSNGRADLWRAWNYPITKEPGPPPASAKRALVATNLKSCNDIFSYGSAASQRTGLVRIALELRGRNDNPATVRLVHQVHVDNTP